MINSDVFLKIVTSIGYSNQLRGEDRWLSELQRRNVNTDALQMGYQIGFFIKKKTKR
jgi:hypothetical protein